MLIMSDINIVVLIIVITANSDTSLEFSKIKRKKFELERRKVLCTWLVNGLFSFFLFGAQNSLNNRRFIMISWKLSPTTRYFRLTNRQGKGREENETKDIERMRGMLIYWHVCFCLASSRKFTQKGGSVSHVFSSCGDYIDKWNTEKKETNYLRL